MDMVSSLTLLFFLFTGVGFPVGNAIVTFPFEIHHRFSEGVRRWEKSRSWENFELNIYSPNSSLTSRKVFCNSTLCDLQRTCLGSSDLCPYKVAYISSETASSGVLMEDVLYLTTEDAHQEAIEANVIFGCGQVQTGSFLDSAAPNGLFGLRLEKISVPSVLASSGLISNSFSMCFGHDGVGRIGFGDKGSSDQAIQHTLQVLLECK